MSINAGMFSSKSDKWETPQWFFDQLDREFRFTLDVCAIPENAKCAKYFTPEQNGLQQIWTGTCWMNPPYGRQIGKWVKKAWESAQASKGREQKTVVVCLLPARTDTQWWHDYVMKAAEIRLVKGRLKFGVSKSGAPYEPSKGRARSLLQPQAGEHSARSCGSDFDAADWARRNGADCRGKGEN